ncbi:hypothetical protein Ancab_022771 [Ancistrocladus abbreviatus]
MDAVPVPRWGHREMMRNPKLTVEKDAVPATQWGHKNINCNLQVVETMRKNAKMAWLSATFIGRVHDMGVIPSLQKRMSNEGLLHYDVRYIGGDLVLLSSLNAEALRSSITKEAE